MRPPLKAEDDLWQKLVEGDFPLAVDTQEERGCSKEQGPQGTADLKHKAVPQMEMKADGPLS